MFSKSTVLPTLAAFMFFYFIPPIFYGASNACFKEYELIDTMRNDIFFSLLATGVLIMSFAFVQIFQKWSGGDFSNKNGFTFGIWIAVLYSVSESFIEYALQGIAKWEAYLLDAIYWIVMFAIGGVLIALVSRKTS